MGLRRHSRRGGALLVTAALALSYSDAQAGERVMDRALGETVWRFGEGATRLVAAGSGTTLPALRVIADAFAARHPGIHLVIPDSVGSTGAVAAVKDGAVDVGLLSRPLRDREAAPGLRALPFARVPVVLAVHETVPDGTLTRAQVLELFGGHKRRWSDGSPVVVLQREPGDSGSRVLANALAGLDAVFGASHAGGRWPVLFTDQQMARALSSTPGAVGVFDAGAIAVDRLPLRAVHVQDMPSPLTKYLALLLDDGAPPAAKRLAAFCRSPEALALLTQHGYLPPELKH